MEIYILTPIWVYDCIFRLSWPQWSIQAAVAGDVYNSFLLTRLLPPQVALPKIKVTFNAT